MNPVNLFVFERKVLQKIYGAFFVDGENRERMNSELYDHSMTWYVELKMLRWLGQTACEWKNSSITKNSIIRNNSRVK